MGEVSEHRIRSEISCKTVLFSNQDPFKKRKMKNNKKIILSNETKDGKLNTKRIFFMKFLLHKSSSLRRFSFIFVTFP